MTTSPQGLSFLQSLRQPALIGMIHVGALPGTPRNRMCVAELSQQAVREAAILSDGGVDAIILENMHDVPYLNRNVGAEIVAGMTAVCLAVRESTELPLGVQVLAGANREAIAVAHAAGLQFVRCEGFAFSHVADEGLMAEADAGPLLRYRRAIGAEQVAVIADIKKKHSAHAITADVSLAEMAKAAIFMGADGVVVTGTATGEPARPEDLRSVVDAIDQAVFIGSGVTPDNARDYAAADGWIVGSYLKRDGHWENPPDAERVNQMRAAASAIAR
ncbi:MAG: BtpA/SgcQ family protein [Phycisphaerales bacterium]|nr:BtpA/SgcQ family protein [Phycisphaerales bacterium]MCB9862099.1 BtpA/SgcQ family protein [Phycisphaerales bacterium]